MANTTTAAPLMVQGIASPNAAIDPATFYAATRRMRFTGQGQANISGLGSSDQVQLRQVGIVSEIELRVTGTVTFGGTITGTTMSYEWPLNLLKNVQLSANGQSNLVSARGLTLRALDFSRTPGLTESGQASTFGSTAVTSGTLKFPSDDWGTSAGNSLTPGGTVAAAGTYTVDLTFIVPVAADPVSLIAAIYAQSSGTNLTLAINWANQSDILTALGGAATFASALKWQATIRAYSIPQVNGRIVLPDLTQFHQVVETRSSGLSAGQNQFLLPGTGTGRRLLRLLWNVYSSASPLAMTDTNYGQVDWAYGGNDVPEFYPGGTQLRAENYRVTGTDLGGHWGIGLWDFASQFALRDTVDMGTVSDLRLEYSLASAPTNGYAQVTQEVLFAASAGA